METKIVGREVNFNPNTCEMVYGKGICKLSKSDVDNLSFLTEVRKNANLDEIPISNLSSVISEIRKKARPKVRVLENPNFKGGYISTSILVFVGVVITAIISFVIASSIMGR